MLYAKTFDGQKVKASPSLKESQTKVFCPFCDPLSERPLRHNCGSQKIPYFSHPPGTFCNEYGKETDWHLEWKQKVHSDYCEVIMERNGIRHIADIKNNCNLVIELQHSKISQIDIEDREAFYDDMVWLFDATNPTPKEKLEKPCKRIIDITLYRVYDPKSDVVFYEYHWKRARQWILNTKKPLFLDMGDDFIFYIPNGSFEEGYCCEITKDHFIDKVLKGKGLRKLPQCLFEFEQWMEQIGFDKKNEDKTIKEMINADIENIIQKDVEEQIFFNVLQDEIQLCNQFSISKIVQQETIIPIDSLKIKSNVCELDNIANEKQIIDQLINEVELKKGNIQYLADLSFYDSEIVHSAIVKICDFIADKPVYIKNPYRVCEKIKYKTINFRLHIFEYLQKKHIISYSDYKCSWYISNEEFIKKVKESPLHTLLEQKWMLQNE